MKCKKCGDTYKNASLDLGICPFCQEDEEEGLEDFGFEDNIGEYEEEYGLK
jgi:hypothetical protein